LINHRIPNIFEGIALFLAVIGGLVLALGKESQKHVRPVAAAGLINEVL
jgi:hypothetical protein